MRQVIRMVKLLKIAPGKFCGVAALVLIAASA